MMTLGTTSNSRPYSSRAWGSKTNTVPLVDLHEKNDCPCQDTVSLPGGCLLGRLFLNLRPNHGSCQQTDGENGKNSQHDASSNQEKRSMWMIANRRVMWAESFWQCRASKERSERGQVPLCEAPFGPSLHVLAKGLGIVVRSTLRAVPAPLPDPFFSERSNLPLAGCSLIMLRGGKF